MESQDPALNDGLPLQYSCDPVILRTTFLGVPSRLQYTELQHALERAVSAEGNGPGRGQRHVVVYSPDEPLAPSVCSAIASAARKSGTAVHAICLAPNTVLEQICGTTNGSVWLAGSEREVAALVEQTCQSLTARYTIRYQPAVRGAQTLSLRVQSSGGWGETAISIPRDR